MKCEVWSVKFEVWSAKSAVCSVRCGVSREGHGRDRLSLNYRSFMFGKLPPPACPGLCYKWRFIVGKLIEKMGGLPSKPFHIPLSIHPTVGFRGLVATFPQSTCEFSGTSEVLAG